MERRQKTHPVTLFLLIDLYFPQNLFLCSFIFFKRGSLDNFEPINLFAKILNSYFPGFAPAFSRLLIVKQD